RTRHIFRRRGDGGRRQCAVNLYQHRPTPARTVADDSEGRGTVLLGEVLAEPGTEPVGAYCGPDCTVARSVHVPAKRENLYGLRRGVRFRPRAGSVVSGNKAGS